MQNWPLLSLLIWLPILGGALVLALGETRARAARWASLAIAVAVVLLSLPLFRGFGFAVRRQCRKLLAEGLIDLFSSDAHDCAARPPQMDAWFDYIT